MTISKIRILVFSCALLVALSTYFVTDNYVKDLRGQLGNIIHTSLSVYNTISRLNINFLRARRAEKNIIIFRDEKYKDELDSFLNDSERYYSELDHLILGEEDRKLIYPLKRNLDAYRELVNKLATTVFEKDYKEEEIKMLSIEARELNDALADNIMYLSDKTISDMEFKLAKTEDGFGRLRSLPPLILVISVVAMGLIFVYAMRYFKYPLM
jgi:CHASE3 domain sensor protein